MKKLVTGISLLVIFFSNSCTKDRVVDPSTLNIPQTTIYSENFDASSNFPAGWSASPSSGWSVDSSNFSLNYSGASGLRNVKVGNDAVNTITTTLTSTSIVTANFNNITVIYGARKSSHFSDMGSTISSFSYSIDGGNNWTSLSFTENTGDSNWYLINNGTRIALPANASNQASVMFRWIANTNPTPSGTYRIDDFQVLGSAM